ncbi:MAG: phosphonoacetaldehyde hydrolase [Gemmataceae bacterium]|nr:phosphonoacetaldehyde hydrolase [Gemmata sp.]MDW8198663.1 phosphonoacetaldehyde hydrolase [Gemmataceae bacterium]
MNPACSIQLVVFDWAGTTIDHGCLAPAGAFVASFAARGVPVTLAEARGPMGLHKKDHIRAMLQTDAVGRKWHQTIGRPWTEADVEDLYRDVTPRQLAAVEQYSELVPGLLAVVQILRARGLKIAASTGYFRAAAAAVLAAAQRQGYFPDFNICADDVPAGRPAPWMIFRCMEALGVYPPAAVVKVGDTVVDIEDGLNAGCWSVGVVDTSNEMGLSAAEWAALAADEKAARRSTVRQRFMAAGAHAVIDTLAELPVLIDECNARLQRGQRP